MILKDFIFTEITFDEHGDVAEDVQLMRTGEFNHPFFGKFEITKKTLAQLKRNFDKGVRRVELAVDYSHNSHERASGWIKKLKLKDGGNQLWLTVEWTEAARAVISDGEWKYLSADFNDHYTDNETDKDHGNVLLGAALTNRPFIRGMEAVLSELDLDEEKLQAVKEIVGDHQTNEKRNSDMTLSEILKAAKELSDSDQKQLASDLGVKPDAPTQTPAPSEGGSKELAEKDAEIKKLKEDKDEIVKEGEFTKMLSEGKAVEGQRDAFMKNDVKAFAEGAVEANLRPKGNDADPSKELDDEDREKGKEAKTYEEAEDKITELADAIVKEDKDVQFTDAVSMVLQDPANEKVAQLYDAG